MKPSICCEEIKLKSCDTGRIVNLKKKMHFGGWWWFSICFHSFINTELLHSKCFAKAFECQNDGCPLLNQLLHQWFKSSQRPEQNTLVPDSVNVFVLGKCDTKSSFSNNRSLSNCICFTFFQHISQKAVFLWNRLFVKYVISSDLLCLWALALFYSKGHIGAFAYICRFAKNCFYVTNLLLYKPILSLWCRLL